MTMQEILKRKQEALSTAERKPHVHALRPIHAVLLLGFSQLAQRLIPIGFWHDHKAMLRIPGRIPSHVGLCVEHDRLLTARTRNRKERKQERSAGTLTSRALKDADGDKN